MLPPRPSVRLLMTKPVEGTPTDEKMHTRGYGHVKNARTHTHEGKKQTKPERNAHSSCTLIIVIGQR